MTNWSLKNFENIGTPSEDESPGLYREFNDLTREIIERDGCTPIGFTRFYKIFSEYLNEEEPKISNLRIAVRIYNSALKDAQIEDKLAIYFHYTSSQNAQKISASGKLMSSQVIPQTDSRKNFGEGIYVTRIPPEEHIPVGETISAINVAKSLSQPLLHYLTLTPHYTGLDIEHSEKCFVIIAPKSQKAFSHPLRDKFPNGRSEFVYNQGHQISLDIRDFNSQGCAILGPYENTESEKNKGRWI